VTSNVSNNARTRGDAFAGGFISVYFTANCEPKLVLADANKPKISQNDSLKQIPGFLVK